MLRRRTFAGALALPMIARGASAQSWPAQPVRLTVGYAAGQAIDILARLIAQSLTEQFGQQFIVENKPGAGGNIAADMVAHSDADGYTIFIVGGMATNKFLYPSLSYDPIADFAPVTMLITQPNMLKQKAEAR